MSSITNVGLVAGFCFICFLSWGLGVFLVRRRYRLLGYDGPKPLPFLGNVLLLRKNPQIQELYSGLAAKYGQIFMFMLGLDPVIVISDPDAAREVLVKKFRQFHDRPFQAPPTAPKRQEVLRSGILLARGHLWTSLRAAAQPVFHAESLSKYALTMNAASDAMLATIQRNAESGQEFSFGDIAGQVTMKVIMKCAFGVDIETHTDGGDHQAIAAAREFFARNALRNPLTIFITSIPRALRPVARQLVWWLGDNTRMERARDVMFSMSNLLAKNYAKSEGLPPFVVEKEILGDGASLQVLPPDSVPSKNSIVAAMMHAKNRETNAPLSPPQLLAQGNIFILAGYETTAAAVTFCTYLLACNPQVENKFLAEIDAQGRDARPVYDNLDNWPYAKACFRETLRLYPIGPILTRECREATTVAGRWMPKGSYVHVNVWGMHHNPEYFPEPEVFRPERFIEAAAAGNPDLHAAYMPFGLGPHNCIGWRFAMEEGIILLIRLYQKYLFRLSPSRHPGGALPVKTTITMSPKDGLWVTAIPR